jgi:hypothetical protein
VLDPPEHDREHHRRRVVRASPPHADGEAKVQIDSLEVIESTLARRRTPEGFAAAELDPESGTVTWPGGADLAPDTLYERVKTGAWPGRRVAA